VSKRGEAGPVETHFQKKVSTQTHGKKHLSASIIASAETERRRGRMLESNVRFTGEHELVELDLTRGVPDGCSVENLSATESGLVLATDAGRFAESGCFETGTFALSRPANELVMTWNGNAAERSSFLFEFKVRASGGPWSVWYTLGMWKPEKRLKMFRDDPEYGPLEADILKATRHFDEAVCRAHFRSYDGDRTPSLRRLTLCATDSAAEGQAEIDASDGGAFDIAVPWLSQHDPATVADEQMRKAGACAPTSTTMVLRYWGVTVEVAEVGRRAFDPSARIFGNWAFLVAAASEFGLSGRVRRFNSLAALERVVRNGSPAIVSVSYRKGDLTAKPQAESSGHLMVLRGVASNGDMIVNDPDAASPESGEAVVYPRLEFARAFFGHGGVALLISP